MNYLYIDIAHKSFDMYIVYPIGMCVSLNVISSIWGDLQILFKMATANYSPTHCAERAGRFDWNTTRTALLSAFRHTLRQATGLF